MQHKFAALIAAGVVLAQLSAPGASYNGGIPSVPGTSVPESSPATTIPAPRNTAPSSSPAAPTGGTGAGVSSATGPAYSFGAAPAPIISPGR